MHVSFQNSRVSIYSCNEVGKGLELEGFLSVVSLMKEIDRRFLDLVERLYCPNLGSRSAMMGEKVPI